MIIFHIPGALREFAAGQAIVEIPDSPATLAAALSALWAIYPGLRDRIATEQGEIREHINIFIGEEHIRYTGGLASPVRAGSEISIVPAVSGGRVFSCGDGCSTRPAERSSAITAHVGTGVPPVRPSAARQHCCCPE